MIKSFKHPFEPQEIWDDASFHDFLTPDSAPPIARRHLCYGGKSGTSSGTQFSSTSAPGNVTAWATDAFNRASNAASQPFQQYSGEFVAPVNAQQNTAIGNINNASGTYAPYASQAQGALNAGLGGGQALTLAGAGPANPGALNINQYLSPYLNDVVSSTLANLRQQQGQEQSSLAGNAIQAGAFGGDRAGVAGANLARQQDLATGQTVSGLLNQGYNTALSTAQQQQGVGLSAQQANLARLLQAGGQFFNQGLSGAQGIAGLGTQEQTNQLNAANAQLGAGTLQQQTQQQLDAAKYNQFLQQQAYPFQTAQFLVNALQGVAPVFGTTTTGNASQTTPMPFFKRGGRVHDMEIDDNGEWRMPDGSPEFWRRKLERVGLAGGGVSDDAIARLYPWLAGKGASGPYGVEVASQHNMNLPQAKPMDLKVPSQNQGLGSSIGSINRAVDFGKNLGDAYKTGKDALVGSAAVKDPSGKVLAPASGGLLGTGGKWDPDSGWFARQGLGGSGTSGGGLGGASSVMTLDPSGNVSGAPSFDSSILESAPDLDAIYRRGGRVGLAYGGMPYADQTPDPIVPQDISEPLQVQNPFKFMQGLAGAAGGGQGGGHGGGGGGLGSTLGSIAKIASFVVPFLHTGGRVGKDAGGATGDPVVLDAPQGDPNDEFTRMLKQESGTSQYRPNGDIVTSPKGAVGIAQVMPGTAPEAAKLAGVEWNPELFYRKQTGDPVKDKEAEDYNRKLGNAYYLEQRRVFGDPATAQAAYNAGPQAVRDAQARAQREGGSYLDYLPKETQGYVSALMPGRPDPSSVVGAFVPSGLSAASAAPPDPADSKPSWWDRETGGLSGTERGIISLLSGLGGMASSPSRFLGSAILQGLGAGANTYGALAQHGKQLDIAQQQANTATGRLGIEQTAKDLQVLTQLRTLAAGYAARREPIPGWLDGQIKTLAARIPGAANPGNVPYAPTSLAPVSTPPRTSPVISSPLPPPSAAPVQQAEADNGVKTLPDGTPITDEQPKENPLAKFETPAVNANIADPEFRNRLGPDNDPIALRETARNVQAYDTAQADRLIQRAQQVEEHMLSTGKALSRDGKVIDVPGWAEQQASVGRVEPNQKWLDEQGSEAIQRAQAREQLDVIRNILETYKTGSLAEQKAQMQAIARAFNLEIPDTAGRNAEAYQTFMKSALRNVFQNVKDMGGRPLVSEIEGYTRSMANPELQPGANREILAQLYGALDQADKFYGDTASVMSKNKALDRGAYTAEWLKQPENKLPGMIDETRKGLAVRGATPTDISKMKPGQTYIIEPGQFPGVTQLGKYRLGTDEKGRHGLVRVQ